MSEDRDTAEDQQSEDSEEGLTILQLFGSTLAAAFGVQSSKNRNRDFSRGKPSQFIIVGIVLTVLFVLGIISVVRLVLSSVDAG